MDEKDKPGRAGVREPGSEQETLNQENSASSKVWQTAADTNAHLPAPGNARLAAALAYTIMGWAVLPLHNIVNGICSCRDSNCKSPGKHPRIPNGVHGATRNPAQITTWFSKWPGANIGVATGAVSGIVVVDVDPRNGGDLSLEVLQQDPANVPDTLTQRTGRGGTHFVYRLPAGFKLKDGLGKRHKGIDFQGDGKYVVVAPSATVGDYLWIDCKTPIASDTVPAPEWMLDSVRPERTQGPAPLEATSPAATLPQEQLEEIRDALKHVSDWDDRKRWLDVGMALHSTGAGAVAFDMWIEWSKQSSKFDPADQERNWASFTAKPGGITIGTLFKLARENGWQQGPMAGVDVSAITDQAKVLSEAAVNPATRGDICVVDRLEGFKPTDADKIPGVLGQVEDYYNQTSIVKQPAFAGVASIALGSVALARLYIARAGQDSYSGLYLCEVVGTGGGKEYARAVVEEFLTAAGLDTLIGPSGYTSAAGVFSALLAQPSHFAYIDELGRHLAASKKSGDSHQQQVITELLKLWGALGVPFRYRGYATTLLSEKQKEALRQVVKAPSITLLGASTPSTLYEAVGTAGILDGFLNRLLFFFGDDEAHADAFVTRPAPVPLPTDVVTWLREVQLVEPQEPNSNLAHANTRNHDVKPEPVVLRYDDRAHAAMLDFQSDVETRKGAATKSGLAEIYMRTVEKAIRLALIAAVSDRSDVIKPNHAEWAARRAMASDSALERAAAGNLAETDHGKLCNAIWRAINKHMPDGIAEGSLASVCRPYREARGWERKAALETLSADRRMTTKKSVGGNGHHVERLIATRPHGDDN